LTDPEHGDSRLKNHSLITTLKSLTGNPPLDNPVGGWYGLKKGLPGRFANYVPPVMEVLGLAEVEHHAKNNRMRAI